MPKTPRRGARLPPDALEFFRQQGAKGGRKGGRLSWEVLTPAQRSARARKAGLASAAARKGKAKAGK